jgi:hypothetical protein
LFSSFFVQNSETQLQFTDELQKESGFKHTKWSDIGVRTVAVMKPVTEMKGANNN